MIRPALPEDAKAVAPLLVLAMGHIAGIFARSTRYEDAIPFFEAFFKDGANQYSYANTLVFENENGVIGAITGYDGGRLRELRQPVLDKLREAEPDFTPGDETEPGEYYIDCVNAFCKHAGTLGYARAGLIVDMINPAARRLYENLSFRVIGEKDFMGHRYFHMVRDL
jgi:hypothetical protein